MSKICLRARTASNEASGMLWYKWYNVGNIRAWYCISIVQFLWDEITRPCSNLIEGLVNSYADKYLQRMDIFKTLRWTRPVSDEKQNYVEFALHMFTSKDLAILSTVQKNMHLLFESVLGFCFDFTLRRLHLENILR